MRYSYLAHPRRRLMMAIGVVFVLAAALLVAGAAEAKASSTSFQIAWTKIGIYPRTGPSMSASKSGAALSDGAWVTVSCETTGDSVTSDVGTSTIWERLANGTYLPNVFIETHANGWTPGIPRCGASVPAQPAPIYNRVAAAAWARAHYADADVPIIADCTYFASNVLNAGGISQEATWSRSSTDRSAQASVPLYLLLASQGPTKRWASADFLKNYIVNERHLGTITEVSLSSSQPGGAQVGDLIMYDWGGTSPGIIDHVSVVTGTDSRGVLTVTQKEKDRLDRAWNWDPDSKSPISQATPGTRAYVVHITY